MMNSKQSCVLLVRSPVANAVDHQRCRSLKDHEVSLQLDIVFRFLYLFIYALGAATFFGIAGVYGQEAEHDQ